MSKGPLQHVDVACSLPDPLGPRRHAAPLRPRHGGLGRRVGLRADGLEGGQALRWRPGDQCVHGGGEVSRGKREETMVTK